MFASFTEWIHAAHLTLQFVVLISLSQALTLGSHSCWSVRAVGCSVVQIDHHLYDLSLLDGPETVNCFCSLKQRWNKQPIGPWLGCHWMYLFIRKSGRFYDIKFSKSGIDYRPCNTSVVDIMNGDPTGYANWIIIFVCSFHFFYLLVINFNLYHYSFPLLVILLLYF